MSPRLNVCGSAEILLDPLLINSTPVSDQESLRLIGIHRYRRREIGGLRILGTRKSSTCILKSPPDYERGHIEENNKSEQKVSPDEVEEFSGNVIASSKRDAAGSLVVTP